jgi:putative aminopeptidase FrvX
VAIPTLLFDLLTAPGPSGHEAAAAHVWRHAAAAFADVTSDAAGSSVARVGGTAGRPLLALVGHIDEIGLVVTHVSDDGFVFFRGIGGWNPQVLYGQRVEVLGRDGRVRAVVGRKRVEPPKPGEARKAVGYDDLHLDVGARTRAEAEELVRPGDVAVVAAEPIELSNRRLASRALDDRLGAYAVLEAARRLAQAPAAAVVAAVASVGEEAGDYSGARTVIHGLEPDVALVVDVTDATDVPEGDPKAHGELRVGAGPAIGRGLPVNQRVSDLLFEVAEAEGIAAVPEIFAGTSSSDADAVHLSRGGVPTGVVSLPIRYLHTPNELVSLDDLEAAIRLLVAFAGRLRADTSFAPQDVG